MIQRFVLGSTALGAACLVALACGTDRAGFDDREGTGGTFDPDAAGSPPLATGGDPEECGRKCSSDLHSIMDCGRVVSTCPPDQGCADGVCVPACDAAAANKTSIGCDYFVYPPAFATATSSCLAAFVANTWGSPVKVTVTRGGQTFDASTFAYLPTGSGPAMTYAPLAGSMVPPNSVALVLLSREHNAPFPVASCPSGLSMATGPVAVSDTGVGEAFRIRTDAPVVSYDIFPYGGGSSAVTSATLLIPTTAWGDNYIGTTAYPQTVTGNHPWMGIVAAEDGTEVTVSPSVAIVGGVNVAGTAAGTPVTYKLNAGQYVQLAQSEDLTGSVIRANKPIGSWAGNTLAQIPAGAHAADAMHLQVPPIRALGSRYAAVRYRNRLPDAVEESPPWRVVGAVDGTTLTYDPPQPGAPTSISSGQLVMFNASGPFVVTSQDAKHPFYFGAYMTSCGVPGKETRYGCVGDPEFVNVIPPEQYLSSYVFFTDPTYPETNLVFVREKGSDGTFKNVDLDCVGTIGGWAPINANFEFTRVDLSRDNFQKQGACDNGRHLAKSDGRFGLTVWGWGSKLTPSDFWTEAVSYAYPAGASVLPINDVVVPPVVK